MTLKSWLALSLPLLSLFNTSCNKGDPAAQTEEERKVEAAMTGWNKNKALEILPAEFRPAVGAMRGAVGAQDMKLVANVVDLQKRLLNGDAQLATDAQAQPVPAVIKPMWEAQLASARLVQNSMNVPAGSLPDTVSDVVPPTTPNPGAPVTNPVADKPACTGQCPVVCAAAAAWASVSVCAWAEAWACAKAVCTDGKVVEVCSWAKSQACANASAYAFFQACAGG